MHPELLKEIVSLCKRRQTQGDHPTEPIADAEVLENAIVQLSAVESVVTEPLLQRIAELERQLEEARKDAKPCPTCESLARAVMLDQTGKA